MSLGGMTNEITWRGHMATTLQLHSFLGASSVERVIYRRRLVFVLWNGWKNLLPINKKVRRKNQIFEYPSPSPKGYDEENTRSIDEKPPNPVGVLWKKTKRSMKSDWWKTSSPSRMLRRKTGRELSKKKVWTSLPACWWWWTQQVGHVSLLGPPWA